MTRQIRYLKRGLATRDFIDVRGAGAALAVVILDPIRGTVNIGSGTALPVADIASMLGRLARRDELVHLGALADRVGEPPRIFADVNRLYLEAGFRP